MDCSLIEKKNNKVRKKKQLFPNTCNQCSVHWRKDLYGCYQGTENLSFFSKFHILGDNCDKIY